VVAEILGEEAGGILRHRHGLFFERFANAAKAAIDRGADSDFGKCGHDWDW
jgi:hypothetical protein